MRIFKDQVLGGTTEDSQGECLPLELLQGFAAAYQEKRQPLNQGHDLAKRSAGYIENIRVVDHPNIDGEYALIGDVYCDESRLEEVMGGFSISYLEIVSRSDDAHELIVYLPYPHYKDTEFVQSISEQAQPISVGKWVKKASDPATIALIGAAMVFLIKPIWDDFYKTVIAPKFYEFIRTNWQAFKERKISADFVQMVEIDGHQIQVFLVPDRGKEDSCFSPKYLEQSMRLVHAFILDQSRPKDIVRVHLYFHSDAEGYRVHRVEDVNGNVEHHA